MNSDRTSYDWYYLFIKCHQSISKFPNKKKWIKNHILYSVFNVSYYSIGWIIRGVICGLKAIIKKLFLFTLKWSVFILNIEYKKIRARVLQNNSVIVQKRRDWVTRKSVKSRILNEIKKKTKERNKMLLAVSFVWVYSLFFNLIIIYLHSF